ncbi:hypothetical protein QIS99_18600 [Streptomyces sp. B-S-A8]|uniref:Uncharacterized protein n=1 Tax=Streptomyces solicavernae TaxID=3043614 RepID=A0ABT6RUU1_9ACTN|nr:hypothetical protein [Streptomyces sp. B-S-A8]MDI3388198.1 hypothetical protein [Streptomyces sp. B-S-A8]
MSNEPNDASPSPTWTALRALPTTELRRRAAIVTDVTEIAPMTVDGAERFAWNDSGGQSAVWYFTPDDRILLLTFDHESELNLYAEGTYALQKSLYDGVPDDLVHLALDRPENYESLNLVDDETGATIHYAGGVFWHDGDEWHIAAGTRAHCARERLNLFTESGFDYCLSDYLLDTPEFTAETLVEYRAEDGGYEDEAEAAAHLATLKEIFTQHA